MRANSIFVDIIDIFFVIWGRFKKIERPDMSRYTVNDDILNRYAKTRTVTSAVATVGAATVAGLVFGTVGLWVAPASLALGFIAAIAQGHLSERLPDSRMGYAVERQKIREELSFESDPRSQAVVKGVKSGLAKTLLKPVAYSTFITMAALDLIGHAIVKPTIGFGLNFSGTGADARKDKFDAAWTTMPLTNTARDVFQRRKVIAPTYQSSANIRRHSLLSPPKPPGPKKAKAAPKAN